jgi:plastocyanin
MKRGAFLIAGIPLLAVVTACGSAGSAAASPATARPTTPAVAAVTPTAAPVATTNVVIRDFAFTPGTIQVKVGSTVTWTNQDGDVHTVDFKSSGGSISPVLQTGGTFSRTFGSPGTFSYICSIHTDMHGMVVVTNG